MAKNPKKMAKSWQKIRKYQKPEKYRVKKQSKNTKTSIKGSVVRF
jgi:hypothetical protein